MFWWGVLTGVGMTIGGFLLLIFIWEIVDPAVRPGELP